MDHVLLGRQAWKQRGDEALDRPLGSDHRYAFSCRSDPATAYTICRAERSLHIIEAETEDVQLWEIWLGFEQEHFQINYQIPFCVLTRNQVKTWVFLLGFNLQNLRVGTLICINYQPTGETFIINLKNISLDMQSKAL